MRKVWWNGKLIHESDARVSIYDSALMYGDVAFEMTRSFNKKQFKLIEHLHRLLASCKYLHIPLKMTLDELRVACYEVIEANELNMQPDDEHRLMINVTRGLLGTYADVDIPKGVNVIVADFPLRWTTAGMGRLFDIGVNCVIPSQRAIPAVLLDPKVKNRNRIHYLMGNIEVSQVKGDNNWALFLDPDGYITEGAGCNFFITKGGIVITPEGRNILRGISRDYIKSICAYFVEKNIEPYDVLEADEAFVSATPFCMIPVTSINGVPIGDGRVGHTYNTLLERWSENVGVDIKAQIQSWDKGSTGGTTPYQFR